MRVTILNGLLLSAGTATGNRWPRWGLSACGSATLSWSRLEPQDGQLSLAWLKEAIAVLVEQEVQTLLTLPTAAPPRWLTLKCPEILAVRRSGGVVGPAVREM